MADKKRKADMKGRKGLCGLHAGGIKFRVCASCDAEQDCEGMEPECFRISSANYARLVETKRYIQERCGVEMEVGEILEWFFEKAL